MSVLIERLKPKLLPNTNISIKGKKFKIIEHIVWYQVKSDSNYDKYVLEDEDGNRNYRFWISGKFLGLSEIFHHDFVEPMPKELEYDGRKYKMTQDEFCIVKLVAGEQIY